MGRLRVRNEDNSAWIDICQSEWYIRNESNTGWMRLIPARGLRARHGTNNYWIDIDCLSEEDCGDDPYGGTEDGKGENGSGPEVQPPPDVGYPDGGGGVAPPSEWPHPGNMIPGGGDNNGDPGGGDNNGDNGYPDGGDNNGDNPPGGYDDGVYEPGFGLPDQNDPGAGPQPDPNDPDGGICIFRPGTNECESYDEGGESTAEEEGTQDDPAPCPVTIYSRGKIITETYFDVGTQSGEIRFEYNIYKGSASIDIYYVGTNRASTYGKVSGTGYLSFLFDAAEGNDNIILVGIRQEEGSEWFVTMRCPDSVEDEDEGTITNPAPCHGTYEPSAGGGSGVQEMIHDFGDTAGVAVIDYQMWDVGDKMEVFYNGQIVATTNTAVTGEGTLTWVHQPLNGNTLVTVRITSTTSETSWIYMMTCPGEEGSGLNPKYCSEIDNTTQSGGAGTTDTYYDLGDEPGTIKVRYQMWNLKDALDVYQGNTLVASTNGPVAGEGQVTFEYQPHRGKEIRVRVTGDGRTSWAFLVECAVTNLSCGEAWTGADSRTLTTEFNGASGDFAYLEYATVAAGIAVPNGDPNRIQITAEGLVLDDTVREELRWESHGFGSLPIPVNDTMDSVGVTSPGSTSYWRQTVYCPIEHPKDGPRYTKFIHGIPRAYEFGNYGALTGSGAQMISVAPTGDMPAESAAMAISMFHTTSGNLQFRGIADDNATVWIAGDGQPLVLVGELHLADGVAHINKSVSPGTYFVYVLQENIPDETPGWLAMDIKDMGSSKFINITTTDWRIAYFESTRTYQSSNEAIMPEVEALIFDTDAEASAYMNANAAPSMGDIFNTWHRTDGANYYPSGTAPGGEAGAWQYDSIADRFVMPANTAASNNILSLDEMDNFLLEATLTSAQADDDGIGLVIASRLVAGVPHSLVVIRTQGGFTQPSSGYGIIYISGTSISVIANIGGDITSGSWSGKTTRVSVKRSGNAITLNCTKFAGGDIPTYNLNLDDYPELAKFKGPASFGFYTHSQPGSTYLDVSMPFAEGRVMSSVSKRVWEARSGAWQDISAERSISDITDWPVVGHNPITGNKYFVYRKAIRKI